MKAACLVTTRRWMAPSTLTTRTSDSYFATVTVKRFCSCLISHSPARMAILTKCGRPPPPSPAPFRRSMRCRRTSSKPRFDISRFNTVIPTAMSQASRASGSRIKTSSIPSCLRWQQKPGSTDAARCLSERNSSPEIRSSGVGSYFALSYAGTAPSVKRAVREKLFTQRREGAKEAHYHKRRAWSDQRGLGYNPSFQ